MRTRFIFLALLAFLTGVSPAFAQLKVTGVSIQPVAGGKEQVVFTTNGPVTPTRIFALTNPDRAVIDLPVVDAEELSLPSGYRGTLIRSLRFGRFDKTTSRIVIDLAGPSSIASGGSNSQLTITITPVGIRNDSQVSPFHAMDTPASPVVAEKDKPLIVIDAGHGGDDPGAVGLHKTREKSVTMAYAKALKEALLRTGRYRVALTRDDDRFIRLADRVAIARRIQGDLFISLHADSNPKKDAQGFSIYTLSEHASDEEAAALAERENKSDLLPGVDLGVADEEVASILIDLAQRETMNKSARFADAIVEGLHPKIVTLPRTHRFAGFRVLKAPDIPSVLIEVGFLTNADDEKRLASPEYQSIIADSIIRGIDRYLSQEKL